MKKINAIQLSLKVGISCFLLSLLSHNILASQDSIRFVCENTQVKNGVINSFHKNQEITVSTPGNFTHFTSSDSQSFYEYKNGVWKWNEGEGNYSINLTELKKNLDLESYTYKLRYLTEDDLSKLEFSPILLINDKTKVSYPKISVETIDPRLPIHRTWRLPKNIRAITSANYYIEYNDKYSLLTRIIQSLNSAFLKNTISCKRFENNNQKVKSFGLAKDLTKSPNLWPKSLLPLKASIQQILIDSFLSKDNDENQIKKNIEFFSDIHLAKRLIHSSVNLEKLSKDTRVKKINNLKEILKEKISFNTKSKIRRIFSKEHRVGLEVIDIPIDTTKFADDRDAFKPNKYLDMAVLSRVSLNKENDNYYFYFYNDKDDSQIEVGPFKFKNIYWKSFNKNLSSCTERVMKYFNEYERKSFVFTRSESLPINDELILYEREHKKYPLKEIIITNNCRGPGSIEFEWPGIMKTYFQLPMPIMDQIYKKMTKTENSFFDLGVESRNSSFYQRIYKDINYSPGIKNKLVSLWSKYFESDYRWYAINDFDKATEECSITDIESDLAKTSETEKEVNFKYEMGRIHYDQFPVETRMKSGYNKIKTPLVYVKTPCNEEQAKQSPPKHFYPPKPLYDTNSLKYWKSKTCSFAPINFFHYKDLLDYQVHLSMFEVDGVYTGQNRESNPQETTAHDLSLLKNDKVRVNFDFKNAYSFKKMHISKKDNLLNIRLSGNKNFNLKLGNIDLSKLRESSSKRVFKSEFRPWATDKVKGIYKLIGINPFDLSSYYSDDPRSSVETYALFYNDNGEILNHHSPSIGIEQWFLRLRGNKLILDLISHERITPVARIESELPANFLL